MPEAEMASLRPVDAPSLGGTSGTLRKDQGCSWAATFGEDPGHAVDGGRRWPVSRLLEEPGNG